MHIRGVLTKAELECASINPELHLLLDSGKVSDGDVVDDDGGCGNGDDTVVR